MTDTALAVGCQDTDNCLSNPTAERRGARLIKTITTDRISRAVVNWLS